MPKTPEPNAEIRPCTTRERGFLRRAFEENEWLLALLGTCLAIVGMPSFIIWLSLHLWSPLPAMALLTVIFTPMAVAALRAEPSDRPKSF